MARGKTCDFAFLTSSGGKFYAFFMTVGLAILPLTVKNRPVRLFGHVNTVIEAQLDLKYQQLPVFLNVHYVKKHTF